MNKFVLILAITLSITSHAEIIDTESFNSNLSTTQLVALYVAEVKFCEAKDAEFKKQAAPYMARYYNNPKVKKIVESAEYKNPKLQMDAMDTINHLNKGKTDIPRHCSQELQTVKARVINP